MPDDYQIEKLELHLKFEEKYASKIQALEKQLEESNGFIEKQKKEILSKDLALKEAKSKITELDDERVQNHREISNLKSTAESLESRLKKLRVSTEADRKSLAELKKLNPAQLKKNLDKKKKDLREKNEAIDSYKSLIAKGKSDTKIHTQTIRVLKERLEQLKREPLTPDDVYLHTSECGHFKVLGVAFTTDERPFLGKDINYRVIDMRDGASFVAYIKDSQVCFDANKEIPADCYEYIHTLITIDNEGKMLDEM